MDHILSKEDVVLVLEYVLELVITRCQSANIRIYGRPTINLTWHPLNHPCFQEPHGDLSPVHRCLPVCHGRFSVGHGSLSVCHSLLSQPNRNFSFLHGRRDIK